MDLVAFLAVAIMGLFGAIGGFIGGLVAIYVYRKTEDK